METAVSSAGGVSGGPWSAREWPGEENWQFGQPPVSTPHHFFKLDRSFALPCTRIACYLCYNFTNHFTGLSSVPGRSCAAVFSLLAVALQRAPAHFSPGAVSGGSAAPRWPAWYRRAVQRASAAPSRSLAARRTRRSGLRHLSRSNGTYAPLSRSAGAPARTSATQRDHTHATMSPVPERPHTATYQRRAPPRYRDAPSQTHPRQPWPPSNPASRT